MTVREGGVACIRASCPSLFLSRLSDLGMAIHPRKQTDIVLTFKVLQFVNQLRRRVKPRTLGGSARLCQLGSDTLGLRAIKNISAGERPHTGVRNTKLLHHGPRRVCKRRRRNANPCVWSSELQRPGCHVSAASDASGEEVQQYV
jgi:hypothetical protein